MDSLIPLVSVVLGGLLTLAGVYINGRQTRILAADAERRRGVAEAEGRVREWRLENIQTTRRLLLAHIRWLEAAVVGNMKAANAIRADGSQVGDADISLVGDADVIREYNALVALFRDRFGSTLTVDDQVQIANIQARIMNALDDQYERVLRGADLVGLSPAERSRLFNNERIAKDLRLPVRHPTWASRLARRWMDRRVPRD